jgi:hypothetical protein
MSLGSPFWPSMNRLNGNNGNRPTTGKHRHGSLNFSKAAESSNAENLFWNLDREPQPSTERVGRRTPGYTRR